MFCRQTVRELRRVSASQADCPPILFVHQGTEAEGEAFFRRRWPEARAVSDPDLKLYRDFGLGRSDARALVFPDLWRRAIQNTLRGHSQGKAQGDVLLMPGLFMVERGLIRWEHHFRHVGDHPDFAGLGDIARGLASPPAG
jgi:hypothetical protein